MPASPTLANFPQGFANGFMVRGLPILQAQIGNVFWLSNATPLERGCVVGADNNAGTYYRPFGTLQGAINAMSGRGGTPGGGDILMIKPGHAETISSATALNLSYSDLAIIGFGGGEARPQFTLDTGISSTIAVTGNGISIQNCQFLANFAAITALFSHQQASVTGSLSNGILTVTAVGSGTLAIGATLAGTGVNKSTVLQAQLTGTTGGVGTYVVSGIQTLASGTLTTVTKFFSLDRCSIRDNSASLGFLTPVALSTTDNASDGLSITNSEVISLATSGVISLVNPLGTLARPMIQGNYYRAVTTGTGASMLPIAAGKLVTDLTLDRNTINTQQTQAMATGILITTNGSTNSGWVTNNIIQSLDDTTEILATASSGLKFSQNWYSGVADKSGYLLPAADA